MARSAVIEVEKAENMAAEPAQLAGKWPTFQP